MVENGPLTLQRSDSFVTQLDHPDVKVVSASMQVGDFDVCVWHRLEDLRGNPLLRYHESRQRWKDLNLRFESGPNRIEVLSD